MKLYCKNSLHLRFIDPESLNDLTIWQIRVKMAQQGWTSQIKYGNQASGKDENGIPNYTFSIWFRRWDWHGHPFSSQTRGGFTGAESTPENIKKVVLKAAKKALNEWNTVLDHYPDDLGNFTDFPDREPIEYSEKIPDTDILCDLSNEQDDDAFLEAINSIRNKKYSYKDDFTYISSLHSHKHTGRQWELKIEIAQKQKWHDLNLHHYPYNVRTDQLIESVIVDTITSAGNTFDKLYQKYTNIPPGGLTVEEGIKEDLF